MAEEAVRKADVVAMPGAERAEDGLKRLHEALANEKPRAVIIVTIGEDGSVDMRIYGEAKRQEVLWAGWILCDEASNG